MSYLPQSYKMPSQAIMPYSYPAIEKCTVASCYQLGVDGHGSIKVQPDTAEVTLGISTENLELKRAQQENTERTTSVINAVRGMGIPARDITTQSYVIDPLYDYTDGKQILRGYRVLHTLQIIIRDIDKVGQTIDIAVNHGANVINNIQYTISNPSPYYQHALERAIDDALAKAITIGKKLNLMIYPIPVRIMEEKYSSDSPYPSPLLKAAESATPIQAGPLTITAQIQVVFGYHHK